MNLSMKKVHRVSGICVAIFLVLHLINHLGALAGPAWHITIMEFMRNIYRFPPVEIILFACVVIQIVSGIWLVFKKGIFKQPFYVITQVMTGLYLSLFMINHVRAVLMARYQWHVDSNFYFAAWGVVHYPDKLFFVPYYSLSVICAFLHVACAHYSRKQEQFNLHESIISFEKYKNRSKKEAIIIAVSGLVITFLIMISFSGLLYRID
jgi:succinate dehydrogenase/fumarate reductase cytochrome b subunit